MSDRWQSWLDPADFVIVWLASGLGFVWGIGSLVLYPFSVAGFPLLAKLLVDIFVWPLTIAMLISYGVHNALAFDLPFFLLAPVVGAIGGCVIATITLWFQR